MNNDIFYYNKMGLHDYISLLNEEKLEYIRLQDMIVNIQHYGDGSDWRIYNELSYNCSSVIAFLDSYIELLEEQSIDIEKIGIQIERELEAVKNNIQDRFI